MNQITIFLSLSQFYRREEQLFIMCENLTSFRINEHSFSPFKWCYFLFGPGRGNWGGCLSLYRRCSLSTSSPPSQLQSVLWPDRPGRISGLPRWLRSNHPRNFTAHYLSFRFFFFLLFSFEIYHLPLTQY